MLHFSIGFQTLALISEEGIEFHLTICSTSSCGDHPAIGRQLAGN
jgi:hypothetical protein